MLGRSPGQPQGQQLGQQAPMGHVGSRVHHQGGSSSFICRAGLWPKPAGSWGFHPQHLWSVAQQLAMLLNKDRVFTPVAMLLQGLLQCHVPVILQSAEYLFICQDAWRPGTKPLDSRGKLEHVTVNCDKPAHLVVDRTVGLHPPWQRWPPTIAPWHCKLLWQRLQSPLQCYRALGHQGPDTLHFFQFW